MFRELQEIVGAGNLEVVPDLSRLPELTSLTPEQCYISWDLYVRTDVDKAAIEGVFEWVADDCEIAIHPLAGDTAAPAQAAAEYTDEDAAAQTAEVTPLPVPEKVAAAVNTAAVAGAAAAKAKKAPQKNAEPSSIRVSIDKVDSLINMVGELVITLNAWSAGSGF